MTPDTPVCPVDILLVDDSPTDVLLIREALAECGRPIRLHVETDGVRALAYLQQTNPGPPAPVPDLILLDLNLPRKGGREVLDEVKADPRLRLIPVVVLSSSTAAVDVSAAYARHANCYVAKPVDFDQFARLVGAIVEFWVGTATLAKGV